MKTRTKHGISVQFFSSSIIMAGFVVAYLFIIKLQKILASKKKKRLGNEYKASVRRGPEHKYCNKLISAE